jgi:hypothetical protein
VDDVFKIHKDYQGKSNRHSRVQIRF